MFRLILAVREREQVERLFREELRRRIELEKVLRDAASTDALTGLPNRRSILERLELEVTRYRRNHAVFSLLIEGVTLREIKVRQCFH